MRRRIGIGIMFIFVFAACGCKLETVEEKKWKDCSYTVLKAEEVPEELEIMIEEKKKEPFKMSFGEDGYLYVAQGYGTQAGGGYSIVVDHCYETENSLCFGTSLLGPKEESETEGETYPYIVIKMEYIEKNILYQ